ncbi:MAG: hypothetical protein ABSE77_19965 [Acidimicrobiales bacterium]
MAGRAPGTRRQLTGRASPSAVGPVLVLGWGGSGGRAAGAGTGAGASAAGERAQRASWNGG